MIHIQKKEDCCGCTACVSICSRDAITMKPDALGFLYPEVDTSKCIDCSLCEKVCTFTKNYNTKNDLTTPIAYAVRHRDIHQVETSRSGAAFIAFSDWILQKGGIIYGVGYKEHFIVTHKRATSKEQRDEFKGSKYVQSNLEGIFRLVEEDLKNGHWVLFSGTPCQVGGLKSYIPEKYHNHLYTIDIICYGVPSPKLWSDYINYIEQRYKNYIISVNFRDKGKFGWYDQKESFVFKNGNVLYNNTYADLFGQAFLRHSCFKCPYTNLKRNGDITIGDYWGWQRTDKHFNEDGKGCSLVIVNSTKGVKWFRESNPQLNIIPAKLENIVQNKLMKPTEKPFNLDEFEKDYVQKGFRYVARNYGNARTALNDDTILNRCIRKGRTAIRRIKKTIKGK